MSNNISSDEFQRFAAAVFARMDRTDIKIDELNQNQSENNVKQAVINSDVANIKKKYTVVVTTVITLMVGTVYAKLTEQPVINQNKEIKIETKKETVGLNNDKN